jgi:hypothetical protein
MRSRFDVVRRRVVAHERRGLASRVAGAIAFFVLGAVAATELYPRIIADRQSEYGKAQKSGRLPASDMISDRAEAFTQRHMVDYTGAPIPQMTFLPTQSPAAKGPQATPDQDPSSVVATDGIFDAFVTTKPKGMGLGLAICRMIVERHGGQLSAWSDKKRRGALFQFTLPIKPAAPDAPGV